MSKFVSIPNFDGLSPQTTKGDLVGRTTAGATRIPVGADNTFLIADSSQALGLKWGSAAVNIAINTLTGATTLPTTSQGLLVSGTTFAITLPSPTSNSGLYFQITKTDGLGTPISISGTGFVGATLQSQLESFYIFCDGATYWPLLHNTSTGATTYAAGFTGFGTVVSPSTIWYRQGPEIIVEATWTTGTVAATEARIGLPSFVTSASDYPTLSVVGYGANTSADQTIIPLIEASKGYLVVGKQNSGTAGLAKANGNAWANGQTESFKARIRIAGWGA